MESLQNDVPPSPSVSTKVHQESHFEDEINLADYFRVLWKRKYLIVLGSVLPALVVGLVIFLGPRSYKVTYTYDIELDEKSHKMLLDRFYSAENLDRLTSRLRENGLDEYAQEMGEANVQLQGSPFYFEIARTTNIENLQKIQKVKSILLAMTVVGKPKKDMQRISSIVRDNFEKVLPVYSVKQELNNAIVGFKTRMADIEEARYTLDLELGRKKATLEKLKKSGSEGLDKLPIDIVLQFNIEPSKAKDPNELQNFQNVGGNSAYLPLPYQVQAAETQIINFEEQIRDNKEKYDYYAALLKLNEKLFSYVKKVMPSHCTLEQYHSFLTNTLAEYNENEQQLLDYLKAYIKRIENKIATVIPLVERPKVYPLAKGTVKKSAIVFVIALMISIFAAFLLEGIQKGRAQAS